MATTNNAANPTALGIYINGKLVSTASGGGALAMATANNACDTANNAYDAANTAYNAANNAYSLAQNAYDLADSITIEDSVTSTSTTNAASANAVKTAYDLANSASTTAAGKWTAVNATTSVRGITVGQQRHKYQHGLRGDARVGQGGV